MVTSSPEARGNRDLEGNKEILQLEEEMNIIGIKLPGGFLATIIFSSSFF